MITRTLEPELMEDTLQVLAYANADFSKPHSDFIRRLKNFLKEAHFSGHALDLGCGPGDISRRFAKAFPESKVDAVDGSTLMIECAKSITAEKLLAQLNFVHGILPDVKLPQSSYDLIISNSLLHHLHDPQIFWQTIKQYSKPGTRVVVMDLLRPTRTYMAKTLVEMYAATEPEILQRDFYYSLLAAFTLEEIKIQIALTGLSLKAEQISDHHVFISGVVN